MNYKQVIRIQTTANKQLGGYHHPQSRPRKPLKVSGRQYAEQLIQQRRVTTRDIEIARALIGVGVLTRQQIQRLFFNDHAKMASNRLARLYQYHFLDRGSYWLEDMAEEGFEPCYLYTIGAVGLELFALRLGIGRTAVPFNAERYKLTRDDHLLLHDLRISEMFTRLQLGAETRGNELVWFNEMATILRQGDEEIVRPDGMGVLMGEGGGTAYFVEMDRGNTDWRKKVQSYERARDQTAWRQVLRVDNWQPSAYPGVLCVVPDWMEKRVREEIWGQKPQTHFYVKGWKSFWEMEIFEDWHTASGGKEEVSVAEKG